MVRQTLFAYRRPYVEGGDREIHVFTTKEKAINAVVNQIDDIILDDFNNGNCRSFTLSELKELIRHELNDTNLCIGTEFEIVEVKLDDE